MYICSENHTLHPTSSLLLLYICRFVVNTFLILDDLLEGISFLHEDFIDPAGRIDRKESKEWAVMSPNLCPFEYLH